jgi:hypothetical protein
LKASVDETLADDVFEVQNIIERLLDGAGIGLGGEHVFRQEGPLRLVVRGVGTHGDEFTLRVTKGGQAATEDTAGIDVDGVVDPLRFRLGCMGVSARDCRSLLRPVMAVEKR